MPVKKALEWILWGQIRKLEKKAEKASRASLLEALTNHRIKTLRDQVDLVLISNVMHELTPQRSGTRERT